jgi:hypothetical protein
MRLEWWRTGWFLSRAASARTQVRPGPQIGTHVALPPLATSVADVLADQQAHPEQVFRAHNAGRPSSPTGPSALAVSRLIGISTDTC